MQQPIYVQGLAHKGEAAPLLQLHVPLAQDGRYIGELLGEYSVDSLLRYGTPTEIMARYAMTMLDSRGQVLAGTPLTPRKQNATDLLRWRTVANEDEAPVAPWATVWCCAHRPTAPRWAWWAAACSGWWARSAR